MRRSNVRSRSERVRVLLATRSADKVRELRPLFAKGGIDVVDLAEANLAETVVESEIENATTFEENALAKALYFHRISGLPTVADDSGIEVVALGGAPGVHSKRWGARPDLSGRALDDANNALLLQRLERSIDRRARYVCAAAYCDAEWQFVERGEVLGGITRVRRGDAGFGYDPYFESAELGRTFGEITMEEKARVSHRARAFTKLLLRMTSIR